MVEHACDTANRGSRYGRLSYDTVGLRAECSETLPLGVSRYNAQCGRACATIRRRKRTTRPRRLRHDAWHSVRHGLRDTACDTACDTVGAHCDTAERKATIQPGGGLQHGVVRAAWEQCARSALATYALGVHTVHSTQF